MRAKHRVLKGGLKTVEAESIEVKGLISDEGVECDVYEVEVTLNRHGKTHKRRFAEKRFKTRHSDDISTSENPRLQHGVMRELIASNREQDMGLNILPTIRLRDAGEKKPRLVVSLFDEPTDLNRQELQDFNADMERQMRSARAHGWIVRNDSFCPVRDDELGVVAVIADFGGVTPPKDVLDRVRSKR
ncbi:MAG: hypothetical protein GF416_07635 [Candidatus Altiarchaeales archaeon]|nr:hypothetical protein [Candidatus Altiarchaeales archaeon]MBD3416983.1 hypothetical protein [Candidatus Altiarchaeales archaeon]